jgi:hypothetical protein
VVKGDHVPCGSWLASEEDLKRDARLKDGFAGKPALQDCARSSTANN